MPYTQADTDAEQTRLTQKWTEHFGITDELLQQWRTVGGPLPLLSWCLQSGAINETQYMQWASSQFHLPVVRDSFFALPTAEQHWATQKFLYRWTESILPLEDWDGVVRIACTEPPASFQLDRPHAFVLASPRQLQILWQRLFPQAPVVEVAPVVGAVAVAPAGITAPFIDFSTMPADENFDPAKMLAAYNDQASGVDAAPEHEGEAVATEAAPTEFVMPEGFASFDANLDIPMPKMGGALKIDTPAPAPEATAPVVASAADLEIPMPPPMTPPPIDATMVIAQPEPVAEVVEEAPPARGYTTPVLPGAPNDFDLCDSIEEVVSCAFNKMSKHFQYQMALLPAEDTMTPWLWAGKFDRETPNEKPNTIDLLTPSFFRIVMRTSMPYHGHTRPSDVNDKFFKEWTKGAALAHITIVPILIDDHTAFVFMGGMDNVIEPRAALSDMEHWARSAALACRRISEKPRGAAA